MSFKNPKLDTKELDRYRELGKKCRADIIKMTYLAKSGHPGGSMSSIDMYIVVYSNANIDPKNPHKKDRDYIVVSHGHTSPGVYSILSRLGFFPNDELIPTFRRINSPYEGHITRNVPGIEWTTGNLGQGLSAGCGFALASRIKNIDNQIFVLMSDGEQAKGQVSEARRFAKKFGLSNITVLIDYNRLQICGNTCEVMPVNIEQNYIADGWKVLNVDGHNYEEIYEAIYEAKNDTSSSYAIICHTVMGKDVDFMENKVEYHGNPLKLKKDSDGIIEALIQLENDKSKEEIENELDYFKNMRDKINPKGIDIPEFKINLKIPEAKIYLPKDEKGNPKNVGSRDAFGEFVYDLAKLNYNDDKSTPIVAFDCDLLDSVKLKKFAKEFPQRFFETGVQEHNTATISGALASQNVMVFFPDFGVFNIDETYNQHRLNDINHSNLRVIATHIGLDVGQDGKTHHCIDYLGLMRNLYGFKVIIPADANETYQALRYMSSQTGNWLLAVGRETLPIITKENNDDEPYFDKDFQFEYGKASIVRDGKDVAIISMGTALHSAIFAYEILKKNDINPMVVNFSSPLKPDINVLKTALKSGLIITVEDHNLNTGLGNEIETALFKLVDARVVKVIKLGINKYSGSAPYMDLYKNNGIDPNNIADIVIKQLNRKSFS